ncbi:MAG: sensor histidine kinase [Corynebacterium sp.]|nr:sensor histidine kinase [Corynebacterium sp.]
MALSTVVEVSSLESVEHAASATQERSARGAKLRIMTSSIDGEIPNSDKSIRKAIIDGLKIPERSPEDQSRREAIGKKSFERAINVLTVVLLVTCLLSLIGMESTRAIWGVLTTALFGFVYSFGALHNGGSFRRQTVWLLVLTIVWVFMLPLVPIAVYLLFTLFFLYLHIAPDIRGVIAVLGATIISIMAQFPNPSVGAIMGPVVSAIVVIGINFAIEAIWRGARQREALIEELVSTRTQLAETERAAGVAAERQRIAHEIHDTLAQGLSSIQMLLRVAESELRRTGLDEKQLAKPLQHMELARSTAADNLGEARAMIAALQPPALSKTSLEGALQRAAQHVVGPEVTIEVTGDDRQLPMRTEAALLRIGQGALGNVQKHAAASHCKVTLTYEEAQIHLDVVDDGQGFVPAEVAQRPAGMGHIGIDAMRERAKELGGTFTVESAPGEGTAVSVEIPIDPVDPPCDETAVARRG